MKNIFFQVYISSTESFHFSCLTIWHDWDGDATESDMTTDELSPASA